GSGDRAHMMKTTDRDRLRELHGMPRSFDVRLLLRLRGRVQIVNGGEMKKMIDLPGDFFQLRICYAQVLFREIAGYRDDLTVACAPMLAQLDELFLRALPNEHIDRLAALQ